MTLFVKFLVFAFSVAAVQIRAAPGESYTYVINAKRTDQVVPPGHPLLYMYYQISPVQNITFFKEVDKDNPIEIEAYLYKTEEDFAYSVGNDDKLNTCADYDDGNWDYVIVSIVDKGILPGGKCPVRKGSYSIYSKVEPITATFPEKIKCGEYTLVVNLDHEDQWVLQASFDFEIKNDGTCVSE